MTRPVHKIVIAMVLLLAGGIAILYGTVMRTVPVWSQVMVEKEEIEMIRPPAVIWNGPAGPGGQRPNMPAPPPIPRKVKKSVAEDRQEAYQEPRVIRDVTIGGISRTEGGRLQLTYGPGEKGPALCPT